MHKRSSAPKKVPVSERALLQRLNRSLAEQGQMIRKAHRPDDSDTGAFYCVDIHRNSLEASHIDLEEWARKAGVLRAWEEVADGR